MTDTHFHFHHCFKENFEAGVDCLERLAMQETFFALDIGTRCDDLLTRLNFIKDSVQKISDGNLKERAVKFIYFSAGLWPDPDTIKNREEYFKILKKQIKEFRNDEIFGKKLCAIGEGGIDHHWNKNNADHRDADDFDEALFKGESELFEMQLDYARSENLPFIIHSRDGYDDTVSCVKNVGYHNGILHCCSYPLEQVKYFMDSGWYISFSGSVTYTKKNKMEEMKNLLCAVPSERILVETDAPYLAPVPMRGNPNTPLFINHTYEFIARMRNVSVEELEAQVNENCRRLFAL